MTTLTRLYTHMAGIGMRVIGGEGGVVLGVLKHDADDGSESLLAALSPTDSAHAWHDSHLRVPIHYHPVRLRYCNEHAWRRICTPAATGRAREEEKGCTAWEGSCCVPGGKEYHVVNELTTLSASDMSYSHPAHSTRHTSPMLSARASLVVSLIISYNPTLR